MRNMENVIGETALSFDMKLREKTALQHHLDFKAHIYSFGSSFEFIMNDFLGCQTQKC